MTDKTPQGDAPGGTRINLDPLTDSGGEKPEAAAAETVLVLTTTSADGLPPQIPVADDNGNVIAVYTLGPAPAAQPQSRIADDIKEVFEKIGVEERQETPMKLEFGLQLHNRIITY